MQINHSDEAILFLLDNDLFIQWVFYPTAELDAYWQEQINNKQVSKKDITTLKDIIKKLKIKEPVLSKTDKMEIWNKIERNTLNSTKNRISLRRIWLRVASVAAIVALLIGGYWLFSVNQKKITETDYTAIMTNDEQVMRSNDVILTLSDNKKIAVDSSNIVYNKDGSSNIQTEENDLKKNIDEPQFNQLSVPYGKIVSLTLSDGTKIWVNSGSKVIYPTVFREDKREIFVSGEVYLDVVKNAECPFVIKTNNIDVNVLGTKLNISAYNDDSFQSVVLVSGAVEVKSKELKGEYDILPNQMLSYNLSNKNVNIRKVDVNNYISWIKGYLLLNSETLDNVLQKLERHYNISFAYNQNTLKNVRVSGKLNLDSGIEEVLKYISITVPITYQINDKQITVSLK